MTTKKPSLTSRIGALILFEAMIIAISAVVSLFLPELLQGIPFTYRIFGVALLLQAVINYMLWKSEVKRGAVI